MIDDLYELARRRQTAHAETEAAINRAKFLERAPLDQHFDAVREMIEALSEAAKASIDYASAMSEAYDAPRPRAGV